MLPATIPDHLSSVLHVGVSPTAAGAVSASLIAEAPGTVTILLGDSPRSANQFAEDTRIFSRLTTQALGKPQPRFLLYPDSDTPDDDNRTGALFELTCDRVTVLTSLLEAGQRKDEHLVIALTPEALFSPCAPREAVAQSRKRIRPGDQLNFKAFIKELAEDLNYFSEAVCENPGEFAVRGGLVDIYPLNATEPVRIDFFGDEVESIRAFDPASQRSLHTLEETLIAAAPKDDDDAPTGTLADYLPEAVSWVLLEPEQIHNEHRDFFLIPERTGDIKPYFGKVFNAPARGGDIWHGLVELEREPAFFGSDFIMRHYDAGSLDAFRTFAHADHLGLERLESERQAREEFLNTVASWRKEGVEALIVVRNAAEESRLREMLEEADLLKKLAPSFHHAELVNGFICRFTKDSRPFPWLKKRASGVAVITRTELFGRRRQRKNTIGGRRKVERSRVDQLLDFHELADGDHVVHMQHGVCIYRGLSRIEIHGEPTEVITLEFAEKVTIHLPLHESHLLSRYVGLSKIRPKLAKIGGKGWDKARKAAELATIDLASDLLRMQATRDSMEGHAFAPDNDWQREFEAAFPFQETPDQHTSIEDTKRDMESGKPMDRLLCGDVGFGKTEVAIRAAFKAVMDGKQVAILAPTTVLAQQHFNTFRERMADYPIVVEVLSRFRSPSRQRQVAAQARIGQVDILIGTHRLLSKDVSLPRLGLLVIDEEHRFGVRHKEQLKRMRLDMDILSMSATPIPRTLYFALMGARELSVIETAPRERLPIITHVKSYSRELVEKAIRYEVARGGQVFYLHNRVQTIESVARRLREWMPELRIGVGHGQMDEKELEKIMTRFVNGEYDVLVSTTIIESGLDIPNSNTIIIEGADRFGLSQLYQLRGRVGRFNRQAYAYLLLHRHGQLLEQARKRLSSMRQHNQLGAGFRIAMRDLELRGAGHLLGDKQSGHIAGIGFDLYCQLLRQSIARLKGEEAAAVIRATVRLDFVLTGESNPEGSVTKDASVGIGYRAIRDAELHDERGATIEACIPASYMPEPRLRIDFYRRLAMAENREQVKQLADELKDRFGKLPQAVEALILSTEIRCAAEQNGICSVETEGESLKCQLATPEKIRFIKIANRFPRLQKRKPLAKLREIRDFILQKAQIYT